MGLRYNTYIPERKRRIRNAHRVIDPLFMDSLNAEFEEITGISVVGRKDAVVEPVETTRTGKTSVVSMNSTTGIGHFDKLNVRLSKKQKERLLAFQKKLGSLTFLDPACGSGNFLTETYLSLRRLENRIISLLNSGEKVLGFDEFIQVKINQFYGIEINDFAVTVAKTALWIAESQMISETEQIVSQTIDFLPLTTNAFVVEGNALRMDWATLRPLDGTVYEQPFLFYDNAEFEQKNAVIEPVEMTDSANGGFDKLNHHSALNHRKHHYDYIMGNPPFLGYSLQSTAQKSDILSVYADEDGKPYKTAGKIDYVSAWYFKASELIKGTHTKAAFVSTNSITQGEQVSAVWKPLVERFGLEIDFAYRTFKWQNETADKKNMAAVHCVIIGFSHKKTSDLLSPTDFASKNVNNVVVNKSDVKFIFDENGNKIYAHHINGYLLDAADVWIESRSKPLCAVTPMITGNRPADGGHLIIEADEYDDFIKKEPDAKKYIKNLTGSEEFINGKKRYCLWLVGANPVELVKMPLVMERVEECKKDREAAPDAGRRKLADTPTLFREQLNPESYIIVPRVSSENRKYVPIGFLGSDVIPTDSATIIPNATLYEFGILTSSVHMAWMRAVAGRLEMRYRYSKDIVYNNFPFVLPCAAVGQKSAVIEKKAAVIEPVVVERCRNIEMTDSETGGFDKLNHHSALNHRNFPHCTQEQAHKIEQTAQGILDARAKYPDASLADLYDETFMPLELRRAHQANDRAVMEAYGFAGTRGHSPLPEAEIVGELFKMYKELSRKA